MKTEKIAYDNGMFLILTVGQCLGYSAFREAVLDSFMEEVLFPTDPIRDPGYIKIDVSAIKEKGYGSKDDFIEKVRGAKILELVTYGFGSRTKFEGDLNEMVVIKKDGYEFVFHIKEYERDIEHGFEIIKPEALIDVPEDEQLGRMVYLMIKPEGLPSEVSTLNEKIPSGIFDKSVFLEALTAQCQAVNLESIQAWEVSVEPKVFAASIRIKGSGEWPSTAFYFDGREIKQRDHESHVERMSRELALLMALGFNVEKLNHNDPENHVLVAYFDDDDPIGNEPLNIINYASQLFAKTDNSEVVWMDSANAVVIA